MSDFNLAAATISTDNLASEHKEGEYHGASIMLATIRKRRRNVSFDLYDDLAVSLQKSIRKRASVGIGGSWGPPGIWEEGMFDAKQLLDLLAAGRLGEAGDAATSDLNAALDRGKAVTTDAANQTAAAVSGALGQAQAHLQGTQASEYIGKTKELVEQNPVGTLATLGGLAALLLATPGGRATGGGLVKLGGLAAIGGIAYKALRNYQEGKPLTQGVPGLEQLTAAPQNTGFSEQSHDNASAALLVRTMIATAASDGVVDPAQRAQIVGELKGAGLPADAAHFLDAEIQNPATIRDIADFVGSSKDLALQVYAAGHLMAHSPQEKAFLGSLAQALALDPALVAHIDATTSALTASAH
ncbi:MAG: DUF533 domain-containing protein [Methylocella sp.]